MSVFCAIRDLLKSGRKSRRRTGSLASAAIVLESRVLLSATTVTPFGNLALDSGADLKTVKLTDHFDDPAISGSTVKIETPLGSFIVETYDTITPVTSQNFLDLVAGGNYADMFFHRSSTGFVVQGGGFAYPEGATQPTSVSNNGTITNEFSRWFDSAIGGLAAGTPLNTRGTLAMAKLGGDPNSANSQWFVNLADNSSNLDAQNGGFTVFAHVLYDGMDTVDAIAALPRVNAGSPYDTLPVRDFTSGIIQRQHLVTTSSSVVQELTYEITVNTNPLALNATIENGLLVIAGIQGQSGSADVTVVATDLQGNTATSTVSVQVGLTSAVTGPVGGGNIARPQITWSSALAATSYDLWVNQLGGQNAIINATGIEGTSFTPAADLENGDYRVWVRARNADGAGAWSVAHVFTVGLRAVTIKSPSARLVTVSRPEIQWEAADRATEYDVWVNKVGGESQIIRNTSVSGTSLTPDFDLADGAYRVWVKAKNASGQSAWSSAVTFEVNTQSTPVVTAPAVTVNSARPQIAWTGSPAATFELWVNQLGGTSKIIYDTAVAGTSLIPSSDLPSGTYRVWVRLRGETGSPGPWSAAYDFTVALNDTPDQVVVSGVSATATARPVFAWAAATHATRYEIWVNSISGTATRVVNETNLTDLQYSATTDLAQGQYRVWIRAFNSGGVAGPWSAAVNFTLT